MASRQEEKERRRQERMAAEQKAQSSAQRTRRLQIVGGVILAIALVVVVVIVATSGGGGNNGPAKASDVAGDVKIPAPGPLADPAKLSEAAKAAGCTAKTYPSEGRGHVTKTVNYKTNPPTSGPHNPNPAQDGFYDPGSTPAKENYVHTLEHGRIEIQYRPGTSKQVRDQLQSLFDEKVKGTSGYHTLVFENNTNMPYAVAATAWTQVLGCPRMNDKVFDAIRAFRARYVDKAPEFIP